MGKAKIVVAHEIVGMRSSPRDRGHAVMKEVVRRGIYPVRRVNL